MWCFWDHTLGCGGHRICCSTGTLGDGALELTFRLSSWRTDSSAGNGSLCVGGAGLELAQTCPAEPLLQSASPSQNLLFLFVLGSHLAVCGLLYTILSWLYIQRSLLVFRESYGMLRIEPISLAVLSL